MWVSLFMTFVLVRQIGSLNHMLWGKKKTIKGVKLSWHSSNPFNQSLETNCAYKNVWSCSYFLFTTSFSYLNLAPFPKNELTNAIKLVTPIICH